MQLNFKQSGFTLIEIMVAVSIFAIVATVAVSALLMADRINQKAQAIKLVMDNLNFALESMTFKMREGGNYYCDKSNNKVTELVYPFTMTGDGNCDLLVNASVVYFLTPKYATSRTAVAYGLMDMSDNGRDYTAIGVKRGSEVAIPITSSAINITSLLFEVTNSDSTAADPTGVPSVQIILAGEAHFGHDKSNFALQTTVSERQ